MARRGSWTRRGALPAHVIASQQRRGRQLAGRGRRGRDRIPAAVRAGTPRDDSGAKGTCGEEEAQQGQGRVRNLSQGAAAVVDDVPAVRPAGHGTRPADQVGGGVPG